VKVGRELDALIAEKVMGWRLLKQMVIPPKAIAGLPSGIKDDGKVEYKDIPPYSTDIAAAWTVVEKIKKLKVVRKDALGNDITLDFHISCDGDRWLAEWHFCSSYAEGSDDISEHSVFEDTPPHAICLAALKAVEK
jgi:hypothetical protein